MTFAISLEGLFEVSLPPFCYCFYFIVIIIIIIIIIITIFNNVTNKMMTIITCLNGSALLFKKNIIASTVQSAWVESGQDWANLPSLTLGLSNMWQAIIVISVCIRVLRGNLSCVVTPSCSGCPFYGHCCPWKRRIASLLHYCWVTWGRTTFWCALFLS